jgi:hypothetical protein
MGDEYVRGNHDAHITCARIARAALTAPSASSPSSSEREALEDIWALTASYKQYTLDHFAKKVRQKIDAALSASHVRDTGTEEVRRETILWCCHVRGPDDVYAAPDYNTALAWSDLLNSLNWRDTGFANTPKPPRYKDPANYSDCLIKAVPAIWPHSPESHAEDLPKSIAGFAAPREGNEPISIKATSAEGDGR